MVAVGRSILEISYHPTNYHELGNDYSDHQRAEHLKRCSLASSSVLATTSSSPPPLRDRGDLFPEQ